MRIFKNFNFFGPILEWIFIFILLVFEVVCKFYKFFTTHSVESFKKFLNF